MHLLRLLGLEQGDVAPNQEEQIKSLAVELTRLLIQEKTDYESERHSAPANNAVSTADGKLARSRTPIRRRKRDARKLAEEIEVHYVPFVQEKKLKPFQWKNVTKKPRPIDNPSKELKGLQRRIDKILLKPLLFPDCLHGAVPKKTINDKCRGSPRRKDAGEDGHHAIFPQPSQHAHLPHLDQRSRLLSQNWKSSHEAHNL